MTPRYDRVTVKVDEDGFVTLSVPKEDLTMDELQALSERVFDSASGSMAENLARAVLEPQ